MAGVAAAVALLMALAGCGVGQGSAVTVGEHDVIRVGVIPVADFAPVYIAIDTGLFAEEGLTVKAQVMQNAAAIAPAVINGQLHFGTSAQTPFLTATQKGLPLKAVANSADTGTGPADDASALMVAAGSSINRPRDLEGKVVAVNALNSIIHVAAAASVREDGGDPAKVSFVAMPLPEMAQAVAGGRVDAASLVEPFVAAGASLGNRTIAYPYTTAFKHEATYGLVFAAGPFIDKNPAIVRKFVSALGKASDIAANDPDEVRRVLVKYGKLKPETAEAMRLPHFSNRLDATALTEAADLMADLGFLPEPVATEGLVWK
ncbi:ABC transporter substrate-binding protein [Arthrobacter ginkgonis]|uniref:ABC transporter substrate-binding protein n=1 Tax=Arthrobacter ginkgonis TaxID=1630594 RepID=UPI0031EF295F